MKVFLSEDFLGHKRTSSYKKEWVVLLDVNGNPLPFSVKRFRSLRDFQLSEGFDDLPIYVLRMGVKTHIPLRYLDLYESEERTRQINLWNLTPLAEM